MALTTAGVLASGTALASPVATHERAHFARDGFVPAQYYERSDDRIAEINAREARIRHRIARGIDRGRITDWEARRLYREMSDIEARERAFRADGRLGWRESQELEQDLDRLADDVRYQIRDEQRY
ncbi:MAG: hypothetical protein ACM3JC_03990 [Rudaea sp.]